MGEAAVSTGWFDTPNYLRKYVYMAPSSISRVSRALYRKGVGRRILR
ncbi:hypothetical protein Plhal710r2_c019g0083001 [Plasmopara halstedii]